MGKNAWGGYIPDNEERVMENKKLAEVQLSRQGLLIKETTEQDFKATSPIDPHSLLTETVTTDNLPGRVLSANIEERAIFNTVKAEDRKAEEAAIEEEIKGKRNRGKDSKAIEGAE